MRIKDNTNLTIYTGDKFRGLLLLKGVGPYVLQYLERTYDTIEKAVHQYPRVSAIRFDLRYPVGANLPDELMTNTAISKFVDSIKSKVAHNRSSAKLKYDRVHDSVVRYVWAREFDQADLRPHYHFLLLLNRDAFHTVGYFSSESDNLYHRIVGAWASALGLPPEEGYGLVHMPENHTYAINMNRGDSGIHELFPRVSYLCKVNTKRFGEGDHAFGCSRIRFLRIGKSKHVDFELVAGHSSSPRLLSCGQDGSVLVLNMHLPMPTGTNLEYHYVTLTGM